MIIDRTFLDKLMAEALVNERLRSNFNLHQSFESPAQRLFHGLAIGTEVPIHRHPDCDETYILLGGAIEVLFYNDQGEVIERFILDHACGSYGLNIPKGTWHGLNILKEGCVIFECKDGPYRPASPENILHVESSAR